MTTKDSFFTEQCPRSKFYEQLVAITRVLESTEDFTKWYGGKEYAIKRFLQFHFMTDELRVRILNELQAEITSRFNEDQMDVLWESFDDVDLVPDWLWG